MSPRLECRSLHAGYGRVAVVRDVEVVLEPGRVLAVVGPNGAGKTTLLSTIAGLLAPIAGTVHVDGAPLRPGRPSAANRAGVVLVPDDRSLFTGLTAAQNIELARPSAAVRRRRRPARAMLEIFPALEPRWNVKARSLSGGEQQMVAMARALVQEPTLLLVDEMSLGLAPVLAESLLPVLRRIAGSGASVVLVEQHVRLALEVADEIVVLNHGEVVLAAAAGDVRGRPGLLEAAYLDAPVASNGAMRSP